MEGFCFCMKFCSGSWGLVKSYGGACVVQLFSGICDSVWVRVYTS